MPARRRFVLSALSLAALAGLGACQDEYQSAPLPEQLPALSRAMLDRYTFGFSVGAANSVVTAYVFYDPQCPHCATLWHASQPLREQARFVWIPVAMLGRASLPQGATILGAPDPAAAMTEHERLFTGQRGGGLSANPEALPVFAPRVLANTEVARRLGVQSVPTMYVSRMGRTLTRHAGALPTAELRMLLGLALPA